MKKITRLDDEPDVQKSILKAYKDAGGDAGFSRWCKKHQTTLYDYYVKLMPQRVQSQVHVTHVDHDGESARRKLEDAFLRLIDARKHHDADPAVYVDGERLTDAHNYIDNGPQPALPRPATVDARLGTRDGISRTALSVDPRPATVDESPSTAGPRLGTRDGISHTADAPPSTDATRPATIHDVETSRDPRPATAGARPQPPAAAPVNIATGEPSTTAKYLEWSNNPTAQWWANLPGRVR